MPTRWLVSRVLTNAAIVSIQVYTAQSKELGGSRSPFMGTAGDTERDRGCNSSDARELGTPCIPGNFRLFHLLLFQNWVVKISDFATWTYFLAEDTDNF